MKRFTTLVHFFFCGAAFLCAQPNMLPVPGGTFLMGDKNGDADEKPLHRVEIQSFFLSASETLYQDFARFVDSTGYVTDAERSGGSYVWDSLGWHLCEGVNWRHDERGFPRLRERVAVGGLFPVIHVSWNDAVHYCNWLSEREGRVKVYDFQGDVLRTDFQANGYRLPTEAEWEFAAAGAQGKKASQYAGGNVLPELAWYSGNSTHGAKRTGLKKPNELGLYDLSGNVWEWCQDSYDPAAYAKNKGVGSASGKERSLRGGSWNNSPAHCRIANRTSRFPDFRDGSIGFRVLRRH